MNVYRDDKVLFPPSSTKPWVYECIRFMCEEDTVGDTCMKDHNGHMHYHWV